MEEERTPRSPSVQKGKRKKISRLIAEKENSERSSDTTAESEERPRKKTKKTAAKKLGAITSFSPHQEETEGTPSEGSPILSASSSAADLLSVEDGSSLLPRFVLEKHPDPIQRKTYAKESRCIVPKPLVVISDERSTGDAPIVAGLVKVSLVDIKGKDLPARHGDDDEERDEENAEGQDAETSRDNSKPAESSPYAGVDPIQCKCEHGLVHRLEKLRNESPTVWTKFNLRPVQSSYGKQVRLLFEVTYLLKEKGKTDAPTKAYQERLFSKPFEVTTKKKKKSKENAAAVESADPSPQKPKKPSKPVKGEGRACKVIVLDEIPQDLLEHYKEQGSLVDVDVTRPYKCEFPGCGKAFTRGDMLKIHMDGHLGLKTYNWHCEHCGKSFETKGKLKGHSVVHEREFACDFEGCTLTFAKEQQMIVHKRKHFPEAGKPLKCEHPGCDMAFNYPSELKTHSKSHLPKTPKPRAMPIKHLCTEEGCGEGFTSREKFQNHMKSAHSVDAVRETCPICKGSFVAVSLHMQRTHSNSMFFCDYEGCSSAFSTKGNLVVHLQTCHETQERIFHCTVEGCEHAFYRQSNLDQHLKLHEKGDYPKQRKYTKKQPAEIMFGLQPQQISSGGQENEDQVETETSTFIQQLIDQRIVDAVFMSDVASVSTAVN
eukprot:TRINITY_DN1976_c0_g1_i1.p1 TRINITY_DN1976_c0_g1~~TRINITY_DN1976_c0_g1_i1.p1  ORF type:complete len:698 (-),score=161.84 TRINITY_DN1976_c0_g1_i1:23-1996(-)